MKLQALSELHDRIPPFPWPEAVKIIEEELGAPVESFFSHFSQETVAAASFGQVSTLVLNLARSKHPLNIMNQRVGCNASLKLDMLFVRSTEEGLSMV